MRILRTVNRYLPDALKGHLKRSGVAVKAYRHLLLRKKWQEALVPNSNGVKKIKIAEKCFLDEASATSSISILGLLPTDNSTSLKDIEKTCDSAERAGVPIIQINLTSIHEDGLNGLKQVLGVESVFFCLLQAGDTFSDTANQVLNLALAKTSDTTQIAGFYTDFWRSSNDRGKDKIIPRFNKQWDPVFWQQHDFIQGGVFFSSNWLTSLSQINLHGSVANWRKSLIDCAIANKKPLIHQPGFAFTLSLKIPEPILAFEPKQGARADSDEVTIIIPTRDNHELLQACIDSILNSPIQTPYQILVIDNGSKNKDTLAFLDTLQTHERISVVVYDKPFNYAAINNWAVKQTYSPLILFMNDDVEVISGNWLDDMVMTLKIENSGCVGAKLLYGDNKIQHAGVQIGLWGGVQHSFKLLKEQEIHLPELQTVNSCSAVTAACMLIKRTVFEEVNGFDESNLAIAFNDIDLCLKVARLGLENRVCNTISLFHHESQSRGEDLSGEKAQRFAQEKSYLLEKWQIEAFDDPYLNPIMKRVLELN